MQKVKNLKKDDNFYFIFYEEKGYYLNIYEMQIAHIKRGTDTVVFNFKKSKKLDKPKIGIDVSKSEFSLITDYSLSDNLIRYYAADKEAVYGQLCSIKKKMVKRYEEFVDQIDNEMDKYYRGNKTNQ